MIFPLPIRARLALWFFLVFALATFALGAAGLWMVHRSIGELENQELQERVRGVQRFIESRPPGESARSLAAAAAVYDVTHGGKWLQVIDQNGNWIYRSPHVESFFPSLDLPQQERGKERHFTFVDDGLHVRGLIATISVNGRRYTVQTGMTLNRTLSTLGDLRRQLTILTLAVLLLAALAGYILSRKALSPVAAITRRARRIGDANLSERLPWPNTRDELAHMSETLNQMLDRIEAGNRSVRQFTSNAAHELRTPVALLRAEAEVALAFERTASDYRETVEHIQQEAVRIGKLIDDLLMLAKADAGVLPLRFEPLDLNQAILHAARRWNSRLRQSSTELEIQPAEMAAVVSADRSSIDALIDILVENAWRYSPPGATVTLNVYANGERAMLSVTDSGVGIAEEDLVRIFERFYRAGPIQNGGDQGTGLGLALAQWIAGRHGTKIEVESELGGGSCFSLKFPLLGGDQQGRSSARSYVPSDRRPRCTQ